MKRADILSVLGTALGLATLSLGAAACTAGDEAPLQAESIGSQEQAAVSESVIRSRSDIIKSVHAADARVYNPVLWAGITYAETKMAHCYGEHSPYECPGPYSAECGGAVLAGYWDGPCSSQQGGLGLFQFDSGTYSETLAARGNKILNVQGSTEEAIDFVLTKAWYSSFTPPWSTYQDMYDWINGIRIGTSDYDTWLGFLAYNYNGHTPYSDGWYTAKQKYDTATRDMYNRYGNDYWYGGGSGGVTCSPEGGTFCGGNGVSGDPNVLYVCKNGVPVVQEVCANGCYAAASGSPDYCQSGTSNATDCSCANGKYHNGTDIPAEDTYCGFRVCGMDGNVWECQTGNAWVQTGLTCGAGACSCPNGAHLDGTPIDPANTECNMEVCGGGNTYFVCTESGWSAVASSFCTMDSSASCMGNCGGNAGSCWCDASCETYGDCCSDKQALCN